MALPPIEEILLIDWENQLGDSLDKMRGFKIEEENASFPTN